MIDDVKEYLPIGTIVVLKNGIKKLMIYGIMQSSSEIKDKEFDYIGVPYPEGNLGSEFQYLFYHEDIKEVFFKGYEEQERTVFIDRLLDYSKNNKMKIE